MKIKKIAGPESSHRVAWSLRESAMLDFFAYQAYYESVYGESISQARLIEEFITTVVREDKAFMKQAAEMREQGAKRMLSKDSTV